MTPPLLSYTIHHREGNVTLPILYRDYLTGEITGNDKVVTDQLNDKILLLIGNGSVSSVKATDNEHLSVIYNGSVYSLDHTINSPIENQQINAHIL